jgi:hypothetical protein
MTRAASSPRLRLSARPCIAGLVTAVQLLIMIYSAGLIGLLGSQLVSRAKTRLRGRGGFNQPTEGISMATWRSVRCLISTRCFCFLPVLVASLIGWAQPNLAAELAILYPQQIVEAPSGCGSCWLGVVQAVHRDRALIGDVDFIHEYTRNSAGRWVYQTTLDPAGPGEYYFANAALFGKVALVPGISFSGDPAHVYVLSRDSGTWQVVQTLIDPKPSVGSFGYFVAIGDRWAVIGAPAEDDGDGAAYAYRRLANGMLELEARLIAPDREPEPERSAHFGVSPLVNGDTVMIGAPEDRAGTGAVYVFRRTSAGWVPQQKLVASDAAAGDEFGTDIKVHGDVAIVSAPFDDFTPDPDNQWFHAGAVYVFSRTPAGWVQQQRLVNPEGPGGAFASSFASSGVALSAGKILALTQGRGDGPFENRTYLFERSGGQWRATAKLVGGPFRTTGEGFQVDLTDSTALINRYGNGLQSLSYDLYSYGGN